MSKPTKIVIAVAAVIAVGLAGTLLWWFSKNDGKSRPEAQKPRGTSESHFLLNEIFYDCSREIAGEWKEATVGNPPSPGYYFHPLNQEEFSKYCRASAIIEYRAVLDILRRDDVSQVVGRYSTSEAWVRALGHKYIRDTNYLKRILPAYSSIKIDCIIVVHSPEGNRFFIENGEVHDSHRDHQYLEVSETEFLASLNQAPDQDSNDFWLALR